MSPRYIALDIPEEIIVPAAYRDTLRNRKIFDTELQDVILDDPDVVVCTVREYRSRSRGGIQVLILGRTQTGRLLEIAGDYYGRESKLVVFHANDLQRRYRNLYADLLEQKERSE